MSDIEIFKVQNLVIKLVETAWEKQKNSGILVTNGTIRLENARAYSASSLPRYSIVMFSTIVNLKTSKKNEKRKIHEMKQLY